MSVLREIAAEIGRLRRAPDVEVAFSKDDLIPAEAMDAAKTSQALTFLPFRCPPSVARSTEIANELSAYWKTRDAAVTGEFVLRSVLLFGLDNELSPVFRQRSYDGIDLSPARVLDYYARNGGPIYALMMVEGDALDDRVVIFDEEHAYRTPLRYEGYLERVRQTRGFLFWQYLFCEGLRLEKDRAQRIERGLSFLGRQFPDQDYSELWARYERAAPSAGRRR